ncbi:hypothetical protein BS47DRAFT_1255538, partial [Hydnum rufescens UP504]
LESLLENSLSPQTLATYGSGLAHWQSWCDSQGIPEDDCFPAPSHTLAFFLASISTSSTSKINNAMSTLHHWHEINGQIWHGNDPFLLKVCHAATSSLPSSPSLPPRPPVFPVHLFALQNHLDFNNTFDSAVFAVATCAFWGVCHLGELTVPSVTSFDATIHVSWAPGVMFLGSGPSPTCSAKFHVPWTKTTKFLGADICITVISHGSSPVLAMEHHLLSNRGLHGLLPLAHLFAYRTASGCLPMTKMAFNAWCTEVFMHAGFPAVYGHSLWIGGATEHLWQGLSIHLLKIQGCWKSDAFEHYLWKTDEVL